MSLQSWKNEFYPTLASQHRPATTTTNPIPIISHGLQKWIGLRQANLNKHSCQLDSNNVIYEHDFGLLPINGKSCALCEAYISRDVIDQDSNLECRKCPLAKSQGRCCDGYNDDGIDDRNDGDDNDIPTPWELWLQFNDPEPMIAALQKCLNEAQT